MIRSRKATIGIASAAIVSTVFLSQAPAFAASAVTNGGFEVDASGSVAITGWTSLNQRIDLGVDSIAGCTTVDTSDYSALRDYVDTADSEGVVNADIQMAIDDADNANPSWDSPPTFSIQTTDQDDNNAGPTDGSDNMLSLFSETSSSGSVLRVDYGYVVHGPAIYSDSFTVGAGRAITLQWQALGAGDDYAVLGYLLNVDNCSQTEVIDSTGLSSSWTTTTVPISQSGTYRFVFVGGTYDYSWGGVAGSYFYLDNILDVVDLGNNPAVNISIDPQVGATILGIPATLTGGNLKPNSSFTLKRGGVSFYTGTTDGSGNFTALTNLPNDCISGDQSFTLEAEDTNSAAVTDSYSLYADANCFALASSPQPELAATGISPIALWVMFGSFVTGAGLMLFSRRIKAQNN